VGGGGGFAADREPATERLSGPSSTLDDEGAGRPIAVRGAATLCRLWPVSLSELDLQRERAALLELHANVRRAHFETDVDLLLANDADEWINVRDANIVRRRREEDVRMFTEYFDGATYHEWDDIEAPIVSVANDASLAWMIVNVRVCRTKNGEELRFRYAGIETFQKHDGRWIKVVEVGTFARE